MSDAIDRDAVEAILRRRVDGCYGDCTTQCLSCAAKEDIEEIRALPAVPPAAERLARAFIAWRDTEGQSAARTIAVFRELESAEAAYRAAKPGSTGAAPPAVPMRLDLEHETILTLQHLKACAGAWEPDARIVGNVRAVEILAACLDVLRRALPGSEAAPPAAEPAIFQKPPGSCDEVAVRGNNPEPAKEPAPCGTCGGSGNDPYTMTGEDGTKPCATCGGVGIVLDGSITHVTKRCPECRPGGAA